MTRQDRADQGTVSVEFAIVASILVLVAAAMIAAGRIVLAHGVVTDVAAAAARAASIARTAGQAHHDATTTAQRIWPPVLSFDGSVSPRNAEYNESVAWGQWNYPPTVPRFTVADGENPLTIAWPQGLPGK